MPSDYERIMGLGSQRRDARANFAALRKLYEAYTTGGGTKPGQVVRWKSGLKSSWGMAYGQPAIVLQAPEGQREVCIGYIEPDGFPSISWIDPNRLEPFE